MVVLPGNIARRHRMFLDFEQGVSCSAVEQEQKPGLGGERDRFDRTSVSHHLDEGRLRRQIPVPDVVMDRLEVPAAAARLAVQRDEAGAEQIGTGAVSSVEVVRRGS